MEGRMTVCNMSIEAGARAGMIARDETAFAYLQGRRFAPQGAAWSKALAYWQTLHSDDDAAFDRTVELDASTLEPHVTWGTSPGMVVPVTGCVPDPAVSENEADRRASERALEYMALTPRTRIQDIQIDRVFIGSCTNARIEDLRAAARIVKGYRTNSSVSAMVVPCSQAETRAAQREGLDRIFRDSGFKWGKAGCSMCLGMNGDSLQPGERC